MARVCKSVLLPICLKMTRRFPSRQPLPPPHARAIDRIGFIAWVVRQGNDWASFIGCSVDRCDDTVDLCGVDLWWRLGHGHQRQARRALRVDCCARVSGGLPIVALRAVVCCWRIGDVHDCTEVFAFDTGGDGDLPSCGWMPIRRGTVAVPTRVPQRSSTYAGGGQDAFFNRMHG